MDRGDHRLVSCVIHLHGSASLLLKQFVEVSIKNIFLGPDVLLTQLHVLFVETGNVPVSKNLFLKTGHQPLKTD